MRNLIPSKITCISYGFIASIFCLYLANQPAICFDEIIDENWALRNGYAALCDHQYRAKYIKDNNVYAKTIRKNLNYRLNHTFENPFEDLFPRLKKNNSRCWPPRNSKSINYDPKISNIFLGILAGKNYFDVLKTQKLEKLKRKIISRNTYYQEKDNIKNYPRKMPRHGKKILPWYKNRRFRRQTNIFHNVTDNRRWWFDVDYDESETRSCTIDKPDENVCESVRRIPGEQIVQSTELLPYMAFLDTGCGGGIVSDKFVITAGHCVDGGEAPKCVYVGSTRLLSGCRYTVVSVWIHPKFERKKMRSDIALVKVNPSFGWSPAIRPIRLSSKKAVEKTRGTVAGWGGASFNGRMMINLVMVTIPIIQRKKCQKYGIRSSQFCGGYEEASGVTCQSESGGPFVVHSYLVGIVSYGYKCSKPHHPGVYEDVSFHRDWIQRIIGF